MVSYGLAYGMEAYGLSQRLAVPVEEAAADPAGLLRRLPVGAATTWSGPWPRPGSAGYTVTAFGRRRPLPDLHATNYQVRQAAERQAMNAGIQGLAADLFKVALVRLDAGLEDGGAGQPTGAPGPRRGPGRRRPGRGGRRCAASPSRALTGAADLDVPLKVAMALGRVVGGGQGEPDRADAGRAAAATQRPGRQYDLSCPAAPVAAHPIRRTRPRRGPRVQSVRKASYLLMSDTQSCPTAPPSCPPRRWAPSTRRASTSPAPSPRTTSAAPIPRGRHGRHHRRVRGR